MAMNPRESGDDLPEENHEINVTPFIDVMLVLLIIFMVAAPLATVSVPVELPESNAPPKPPETPPVFLTLMADQSLHLNERQIESAQLRTALEEATHGNQNERIHLRADKQVSYGDLIKLMDALRAAGYLKVALVGMQSDEA